MALKIDTATKDKWLFWANSQDRALIAAALRSGQVIAGGSDTVPGLLAAVTPAGFDALNTLKARGDKPYLILIAAPEKLACFAQLPLSHAAQRLAATYWPGPLTVVVKARTGLADYMQGANGTVALRVPRHAGLLALLQDFDGLFSTSANMTGQPTPQHVADIDERLQDAARYLVANEQESELGVPSTIVDCTGDIPRVIRQGALNITASL
ncbi:MAG TPA: L-threonylcarbamoyladenylate synthase [Candidatus Limnocylindria bacterium]|nr:L-threonylcarbamoyladenylate synthase [Candidatus Limnocylindria bacterium]